MKKINIYIGSTEEDLREESIELKNFVHRMADDLAEKGYDVDIRPLPREGENFTEEDIRNSEMCFFLFNRHAGDENERNLDFAYNVFKASVNERPKVYVYFRIPDRDESVDVSVSKLREKIDKQYSHFYGSFSDLDTVKLRMLLNLKFQEMDYLPVEIDGDGLLFCGQRVVDMDKVGEFENSGELNALKTEYTEIEERYQDMKPEYARGGCSEEFYKEYIEVASKRASILKKIEEQRRLIFDLSLGLSRDSAKGAMTPRMKKAYRLLEKGDTEGCLAILDPNDIDSDFEAWEKRIEEETRQKASVYIREYRLRIDVLLTMYSYDGRFDEIEKSYEKAVRVAYKYEVDLDVVLDYADYLYSHGDSKKAIIELEKLLERKPEDALKVQVYVTEGEIYIRKDSRKAEESFLSALDIIDKDSKKNPGKNEAGVAQACNGLAIICKETARSEEAEKWCRKALELRKKLALQNPDKYEPDFAWSCNSLANLFAKTERSEDAEEWYRKALDIRERLAKQNPDRNESDLAWTCNNLAVLYKDTGHSEEAEKLFQKALEIRTKLSEQDPMKNEVDLAWSLDGLACLYRDQRRFEEAEEHFRKSLDLLLRLAAQDPERCEADLASVCNDIAILYKNMKRYDESEKYYLKAFHIRENLSKRVPGRYESELAWSCNGLANLYKEMENEAEAEIWYRKALVLREKLAKQDPKTHEADLAWSINNLAVLYKDTGKPEEAEVLFCRVLEIRKRLAKQNPKRNEADYAWSCGCLACLYKETGRLKEADDLFNRALEIYDRLVKQDPGRYEADRALLCSNYE